MTKHIVLIRFFAIFLTKILDFYPKLCIIIIRVKLFFGCIVFIFGYQEALPMHKRIYKIIPMLLATALVFSINITAFAAKLKVGSVAGLPEKLVVLDDKGNSVSENGEYFFEVENMKANELYTKHIQIMNLREDASYHIYFNAQPLTNRGEIDLENECRVNIYLNDTMIYYGKVTGEGTPDMRDVPLNLGLYEPGDSRVMTVDVRWVPANHGGMIDQGARVVDHNGTSIVREKSGIDHIEGETTFKWIFTAVVEESGHTSQDEPSPVSDPDLPSNPHVSTPDGPAVVSRSVSNPPRRNTGGNNIIDFVQTGDAVTFIAIGVVAVAMVFMIILTIGKKKKIEKEKQNKNE